MEVHDKNNRERKIVELSEASKVPLEHMFNNNDICSAGCYFKTRESQEGNIYNNKDDESICKKKRQPAIQSPKADYFPVSNRHFFRITAFIWCTKKLINEQCDNIRCSKKQDDGA